MPVHEHNTHVVDVDLHDVTRSRFLNYAVSVITSRALPDVRDGLKPVQRRILYTMFHDLHVSPEKSTIKCAKVVGAVLGNYHPHGDSAVYEAMVRLAQDWVLRYPLIHGQGNFGSLDGDSATAYRYTEARLTPLAMEFVRELAQNTVDYRKNFDDSQDEPIVLPARVPQLLINGCTGIAVGVATNIPPHNLNEVCQACESLIDNRELSTPQLLDFIKGPDFPTGGEILESRATLERLYEEGHGRVRIRGQFAEEEGRRGRQLLITSLPYQTNKAELVVQINELMVSRKIPQIVEVRDESNEEEGIRIVLDVKKEADTQAIKAYLLKNTALQSSFNVNMTCLVFSGGHGGGTPARLGLRGILLEFLDFRHQVVTRRLTHELNVLLKRIHLLQGFTKVFDGLDDAIHIIRNADGRQNAALKLIERFRIDQEQADAVLNLQLYKLGRPDILEIRQELSEKMQAKVLLEATLANPHRIWGLVKRELKEIRATYGDARRTQIVESGVEDLQYTEDDFIVAEEAVVILSRDGWVRRVSTGTDLAKLRLRQDDTVSAVLRCSTLSSVAFFSNLGSAYTVRVHDLPVSPRGFGDPVQKFFNFQDGERVISAFSFEAQPAAEGDHEPPEAEGLDEGTDGLDGRDESFPSGEEGAQPHGLALIGDGRGLRFSFRPFHEPSTRAGRRYARPADGAEVVQVLRVQGTEQLLVATRDGHALQCQAREVSFLGGPGRGVAVIRLGEGDKLLGGALIQDGQGKLLVCRAETGKLLEVTPQQVRLIARGGKGMPVIKRGQLVLAPVSPLEEIPDAPPAKGGTPAEAKES